MRASQNPYTLFNRLLQTIVLGYQGMALGAFLLAVIFGLTWMRAPFLGAFFEHTLIFNGSPPSGSAENWDLYNQGVRLGDQLIALNGIPVKSTDQVLAVLQGTDTGGSVPAIIRTAGGEERILNISLHEFPASDRTTYFIIPLIVSAIFLGVGLWIFGLRRSEPAGQAFTLLAASLSILTAGLFDLFTTHYLTYLWTLALALCGGALVNLALSFPQEARLVLRRPYLRWSGMFIALILAAYAWSTLFNFERPTAYINAWRLNYIFLGLSGLFYLSANVYYGMTAYSPVVKTQARMVLGGALAGLGPMVLWLMTTPIHLFEFTPYLFLPIVLFPLTVGYTILRFRFLRADDWLRRGLAYLLLSVAVVGGYALAVSGLSLIFSSARPADNPLWVGAIVFLIAIALEPLRARLKEFVDMTFFRGQRAYAEKIEGFSQQLTNALNLEVIGSALRAETASALTPERLHIYTYDPLNDEYRALPSEDGRPSSDIRFSATSALTQYFQTERLPLYLDGAALPAALEPEQARLKLLNAQLFVALPGKERVTGWLAVGARLTGQAYTPRDLAFLVKLSEQAALAMERVQTVADLERRVQEMNTLSRVSQGVNVTLTFDDVLELIYAQTALSIPAAHFHIMLYNKDNDYHYYAFCVEHNERLSERENNPLPTSSGLGPEVIGKSNPILTQDYTRECRTRGLTPAQEGVFAWLGVPLNAGAETIGALSVGSREAATVYTRGQLELLQAIADQTAGAIVKARLLEETQQRAHQLSTLNEITRQLTSTLELEPLLQNILKNAVNILNCEAGTLFLRDEQTDELIFKVTAGPMAADLPGRRLPPGAGIAGRAAQTRQPVIENQAQDSADWYNLDQTTGFVSRSVLAVPLQAQDRIIGVLEVINRRDGLPFVSEDQTLLMAFAGQGAVAIENARLYTMTDQELAARVEELSVLQRIDRELNASLELDRAMRITLDWALRQTQAEAGLIGMLEQDKLRVVAQQGYDEELASLADPLLELDLPAMRAAVESGQPQNSSLPASKPVLASPASFEPAGTPPSFTARTVSGQAEPAEVAPHSGALTPPEPAAEGLFQTARNRTVVPIRRETRVIGLLLLESASDTQVDLAFLNRLSDHAAIAISNAQLYGEVQRANLAKSDFVSFVAHELKNPMTSIKGYTELLTGGAVGQINEMQTNFLNTIHSNVERMSTLVSDLNDNSKIEADRLRLDYKSTDVADVVDEVVRSTRRQIDEKKQTLSLKVPKDLPPMWADRTRVAQVLTNLVNNAYKYTAEGGHLEIGADAEGNQWDAKGATRVVHFRVEDSGIGISLEDQQKIFQKFFRSEDPKAREAPGTGLGLNITRSLVEMQGGRIWFESEFRKGSTFHFTIPVAGGA